MYTCVCLKGRRRERTEEGWRKESKRERKRVRESVYEGMSIVDGKERNNCMKIRFDRLLYHMYM